jgi:carbon storage regulator
VLVLSRRPGASIVIDHTVRVTVEVVAADDVCLSVEAPDGITVERVEEVELAEEMRSRGRTWDPSRHHVLSRRARPGLVIGGNIRVAVLAISNDAVRIGVDAPSHIEVHREEVYHQIQEANRSAVADADQDLVGLARFVRGRPE